MEGKDLPLYGDGKNVRDWLYVDDHCRGVDFVLRRGKEGEIYNIGGGNEEQNIDITKLILKHLNKPESLIKPVKDRPGHDRRYSIDCSKLKKLGWSPQVNFEQGIKETVDWYVKNQAWWKKIKDKQVEYKKFQTEWYEKQR